MKLEEQLIRITQRHGLAALLITVHNVPELEPWISVGVQASIGPNGRASCSGDVKHGEELMPAIRLAIIKLHNEIAEHHNTGELALLADSEGDQA